MSPGRASCSYTRRAMPRGGGTNGWITDDKSPLMTSPVQVPSARPASQAGVTGCRRASRRLVVSRQRPCTSHLPRVHLSYTSGETARRPLNQQPSCSLLAPQGTPLVKLASPPGSPTAASRSRSPRSRTPWSGTATSSKPTTPRDEYPRCSARTWYGRGRPDRCGARPKRLRVLRLRQELPDGGLHPGRGSGQSYRVLDTQRRTVHRTGQPRPRYRAQCQRATSASVVS